LKNIRQKIYEYYEGESMGKNKKFILLIILYPIIYFAIFILSIFILRLPIGIMYYIIYISIICSVVWLILFRRFLKRNIEYRETIRMNLIIMMFIVAIIGIIEFIKRDSAEGTGVLLAGTFERIIAFNCIGIVASYIIGSLMTSMIKLEEKAK